MIKQKTKQNKQESVGGGKVKQRRISWTGNMRLEKKRSIRRKHKNFIQQVLILSKKKNTESGKKKKKEHNK